MGTLAADEGVRTAGWGRSVTGFTGDSYQVVLLLAHPGPFGFGLLVAVVLFFYIFLARGEKKIEYRHL